MQTCSKCGTQLIENQVFCSKCGYYLGRSSQTPTNAQQQSQTPMVNSYNTENQTGQPNPYTVQPNQEANSDTRGWHPSGSETVAGTGYASNVPTNAYSAQGNQNIPANSQEGHTNTNYTSGESSNMYANNTNAQAPNNSYGQSTPTNMYSSSRPVTLTQRGDNRILAGLLALFLGGLGVQYLYMGKGGKFVLCLVFAVTFMPAAIGILQGVRILALSNEHYKEVYLGIKPVPKPVVSSMDKSGLSEYL